MIPEDHCSLLFAPRRFPFSCLTVVTLQDSTKLWAVVDSECVLEVMVGFLEKMKDERC